MGMTDHADIPELLDQLPCEGCDYSEWTLVGMALKAEGFGLDVWEAWSARDEARYHPGECERKWKTFSDAKGSGVGAGTIAKLARSRGVPLSRKGSLPDIPFGWDDTVRTADDAPVVDPAYIEPAELPSASDWHPGEQLAAYIEALFKPDDFVGYVTQSWTNPEGRKVPGKGVFRRRASEILEQVRHFGDELDASLGAYDPAVGAWIRFNPLDGQGCGNDNVTAFRYALVESDQLDPETQLAYIRALNLPCAAIVTSGGKSVHAIVRVDAADLDEYKTRVRRLYDECNAAGMHVDTQNKNPSRLSRMPGAMRGGRRQELVGVNVGAASWAEWLGWLADARDDLPETQSAADLLAETPPLAPELIVGVLRVGHKLLLAGPSKAGKSFALIELAIAVATGGTWMGHPCRKGKVLYVNLEIDAASFAHRLKATYAALGIETVRANTEGLDVWNLRGKPVPLDRLAPKLIHRCAAKGASPDAGGYSCIILDPIYKTLTGDENRAGDMAEFVSNFDRLTAELGCSVVYAHHHSKGHQGQKSSMDRMSGSGVFARDPDAVIDMTALAATRPQLRAGRDRKANAALRDACEEHGLVPPPDLTKRTSELAAWVIDRLYETTGDGRAGDAVNRRIRAPLSDVDGMAAFRLTYTLREFRSPPPTDVWFDHPIHVVDADGVLAGCELDGDARSKTGSGKTRIEEASERDEWLDETYATAKAIADADGRETVMLADMCAADPSLSKTAVRKRLQRSAFYEYGQGGTVRPMPTMGWGDG